MTAATTAARIELDEQIALADLSTESAVAEWFAALRGRGIAFHPEESFGELVDAESGERAFSAEDAQRLDALMGAAYEVCDPCGVALRMVREPDGDQPAARVIAAAAPTAPTPSSPPPATRKTEQGSKIEVTVIRAFLRGPSAMMRSLTRSMT